MAKAAYKLPNVFVGCPYGGQFKCDRFKTALDRIPFKWFYADTNIATKQLLGILRSYITAADFCIFDISLWNPNVALEIGLADGLGAEYYILLDRNLSKGAPADIQGIQRIEYDSTKGLNKGDLVPSIVRYLVKDHTHPRNIWDALGNPNREGVVLLGHLQGYEDGKLFLAADLEENLAKGDEALAAILKVCDEYIQKMGIDAPEEPPRDPGRSPPIPSGGIRELDLPGGGNRRRRLGVRLPLRFPVDRLPHLRRARRARAPPGNHRDARPLLT